MNWFDANFYLESKLAQLKAAGETAFKTVAEVKAAIEGAGMTVEEHFMQYHTAELTSPCAEFNTVEYINAKVAQLNADEEGGRSDWTFEQVQEALEGVGGAYQHYEMFGSKEGINPSNDFDASAYLAAKATAMGGEWTAEKVAEAIENAGMSVLDHFMMFAGKGEGEVAEGASFEVPAGEQVSETPVQPTPENPAEALIQALADAEAAKAEFLKGIKLDVNDDGVIDDKDVVDDAAVTTNQTDAQTALHGEVSGYAAGNTDRVNAAYIEDETNARAQTLSDAKDAVAKAKADIAKAEGLTEAIDALAAAKANAEAAATAETDAKAELAGADAALIARAAQLEAPVTILKIGADSTDGQYYISTDDNSIDKDTDTLFLSKTEDGKLEINAEWAAKEANADLLTFANDYLAAVNAHDKAVAASDAADKAEGVAKNAVAYHDLTGDAFKGLEAIRVLMGNDEGDMPTAEEVAAYDAAIDKAVVDTTKVVDDQDAFAKDGDTADQSFTIKSADGNTTYVSFDTDKYVSEAVPAENKAEFDALVKALNDDLAFDAAYTTEFKEEIAKNELQDKLTAAEGVQETAQDSFDALTDALADLKAADEYVDQLEAHVAAVTAAEEAFGKAGYTDVIDVDGPKTAGEDSDIFFAADTDTTIANFGKEGDDVLFVADAKYNDTVIGSEEGQTAFTEAGDNNVVEFFLEQSGDDVIVRIEKEAYASATAADDTVDITLAGVTVDQLSVHDGFITMA